MPKSKFTKYGSPRAKASDVILFIVGFAVIAGMLVAFVYFGSRS